MIISFCVLSRLGGTAWKWKPSFCDFILLIRLVGEILGANSLTQRRLFGFFRKNNNCPLLPSFSLRSDLWKLQINSNEDCLPMFFKNFQCDRPRVGPYLGLRVYCRTLCLEEADIGNPDQKTMFIILRCTQLLMQVRRQYTCGLAVCQQKPFV